VEHMTSPATIRKQRVLMYQLADDLYRQRLAYSAQQRPARRLLALRRATRRAERAEWRMRRAERRARRLRARLEGAAD
jgi:hypothetical protein